MVWSLLLQIAWARGHNMAACHDGVLDAWKVVKYVGIDRAAHAV